MADCNIVEVMSQPPTEIAASSFYSEGSAVNNAMQLAEKMIERNFLQWINEPCPGSCPGKLVRKTAHIKRRSRPTIDQGNEWTGYCSYSYSGAKLCFAGDVFDAISISSILADLPVNTLGLFDEYDAACGLNLIYLDLIEEIGDLCSTKKEAEDSARAQAYASAEKWFNQTLSKHVCDANCDNRIQFFEIQTSINYVGHFIPYGEWSGWGRAYGTGYVYCLNDDTWARLIADLAERGAIVDPTGLVLG